MTYNEAIEDFDLKNDEDKAILLFALYGRAMYRAQVLEQQAVNMLAIHKIIKDKPQSEAEYNAIWDNYDFAKSTLGTKADEIKHAYNLDEDGVKEFKEVVDLRNHLTHNYFRFNDNLFLSDSGSKRMIKDFIDFIDKSLALDDMLVGYTHEYNQAAGLTDEKINELVNAVKKEWANKIIEGTYDSRLKNN